MGEFLRSPVTIITDRWTLFLIVFCLLDAGAAIGVLLAYLYG